MPSVATKFEIVSKDEPAQVIEPTQDLMARPEELRLLEALLFAAAEPLDEPTLARQLPEGVNVKQTLALLQAEYASRGVNLVRVGKKWTFRTASDLSWLLTKETVETRKLSRAAIETIAIIAYHQPVTRAEVEYACVGVGAAPLHPRLDRGLVKIGEPRRRQPHEIAHAVEFEDAVGRGSGLRVEGGELKEEGSSKHQDPNTREAPRSKHQLSRGTVLQT
jgi:chromosome segregation and condensation protein ScpB